MSTIHEAAESALLDASNRALGEALVTDYCATEAVGSKELRKMRKLSQLLEHTALSGDTMRKAEHKILQLRSELLSCVEHAARGNGDAFDGLKLLRILELGELIEDTWHKEQYALLARCMEKELMSSDDEEPAKEQDKEQDIGSSSTADACKGSTSQVQGTFGACEGFLVSHRTFTLDEVHFSYFLFFCHVTAPV